MKKIAVDKDSDSKDLQLNKFLEMGVFWKEYGLSPKEIKRLNPKLLQKLRLYHKVKMDKLEEGG